MLESRGVELERPRRPVNYQLEEQGHVMQAIMEAISGLDHGYVRIVVQDGRVVQIETTAKQRF